jgi:hydroxymethylbilane synthase
MRKIIIASRGSELALWQANFVRDQLQEIDIESEILVIKTQGDKVQHLSLEKLEGKGFFTKEIEDALLAKEADLAVHSHKDLPTESPEGLVIAAVSYREDPGELLIIRKESVDNHKKLRYKANAIVGTSSGRRKSQLLAYRPDTVLKDLRGNVPTRIDKLRKGDYDAILLAAAGVERLDIDLSEFHVERPTPIEFIPAPAQGVLALQTRAEDHELIAVLQKLHHADVQECIAVERKILNLFQGGCHMPLGAYCEKEDDTFRVWTAMASEWDAPMRTLYNESNDGAALAERVVKKLQSFRPVSVYITRDLRENEFFSHVLKANGCEVHGRALIDTQRIIAKRIPKADWIFFSSKNGVKHFLAQATIEPGQKLAAVGRGTSDELRKHNLRAHFIGGTADTVTIAKQFGAVCGRSVVLFPQAKGSMKTVQQQIPMAKVIDLSVYETLSRPTDNIPACDVMVFTSPSNVDAFFQTNTISKTQRVVAMGHATGSTLKEKGIMSFVTPASFDDAGLVRAVMGVSVAEVK